MQIKAIVFDAYGTLFDVQAVAAATEAAFPGRGETITQIWRLKQLEYSWLRSLMGHYADFWTVTCDSLDYTLRTLGLTASPELLAEIARAYDALSPYPDTRPALDLLAGRRLAIFSNGSPGMLSRLVGASGLDGVFETVISVDEIGAYKPDPRGYALVERRLGLPASEILFVSSNGFDVAGARANGFRVARIARLSADAVRSELADTASLGPAALFKALRLQPERLGFEPHLTVTALTELIPHLTAGDQA
jgi:2-haloacid dehalogenase